MTTSHSASALSGSNILNSGGGGSSGNISLLQSSFAGLYSLVNLLLY